MKKLIYLCAAFVLALTFTACGDDDDDNGKFVWRGDWNDPSDPNYKSGGYNPIEGVWQRDTASHDAAILKQWRKEIHVERYLFTSGFQFRYATSEDDYGQYTTVSQGVFEINGGAFRFLDEDGELNYYQYTIEVKKDTTFLNMREVYYPEPKEVLVLKFKPYALTKEYRSYGYWSKWKKIE